MTQRKNETHEEYLERRRREYRTNPRIRESGRAWGQRNKHIINARNRARWGEEKRNKMKAYEKTKKGCLMRKYRNMKSRILGIQKHKAHLYKGYELLGKEEFYNWAFESKEFHKLYHKWVESNYERRLAPTVDRIDSTRGYTIDNMRWLTHSENSRLGSISQHQSKHA